MLKENWAYKEVVVYVALIKHGIMLLDVTWMKLSGIMLNKSKREQKSLMISLTSGK